MTAQKHRDYQLFIDGKWRVSPGGERLKRNHPATDELVATYAKGTPADTDHAVLAARKMLFDDAWNALPPTKRASLLQQAADGIAAAAEDLAEIESLETGKPFEHALAEINGGNQLWRFAAAACRTQHGDFHPSLSQSDMGFSLLEPVGVVGLILPWNFPFIVSAERLPFILAAGCTVVVKPSEFAAGTSLLLGEILQRAGLPDGVYNVVTGLGNEAGKRLVDHPDVAMISFTGSSENGKVVMAAASRTLKKVSLELGGKSPILVFSDADMGKAVDAVIAGFTHNAGQCCTAMSRLLIEHNIAAEFKTRLVEQLKRLPVRQPLATRAQYDKVRGYISAHGPEDTVIFAGTVPSSAGLFVAPTIFEGTDHHSRLAQEEIFGPVLSIHSFLDEADAIRLANDTPFGLGASVWTSDLTRGMRVARKLRAGRLWINTSFLTNFPEMPIGGYGMSGIGREAGLQGIRAYSEVKSIILGSK